MRKLYCVLILFFCGACDKAGAPYRKCEGYWKIMEYEVTNVAGTTDYIESGYSGAYFFSSGCEGTPDSWCSGDRWLQFPDSIAGGYLSEETFEFRFIDDAQRIAFELHYSGVTNTIEDTAEVIELSKSWVVFIFENGTSSVRVSLEPE